MPDISLQNFVAELHSLDTKIQVIAQRMKIIERNEEVIGKTLISHNKIIKELEEAVSKLRAMPFGADAGSREAAAGSAEDIKRIISEMQKIAQNAKVQTDSSRAELDKMNADIKEIKYVLENFNPIAYVTTDNVADIVEEKVSQILKKKGKIAEK